MKKLILGIILLLCVNSYAINGFSIYKMYSQFDTVTHTNLDSNLNRPASWSSLLVDTLDRRFIRFTDLTSGDSTLSVIKVDTIKSNPYMDSITGSVRIAGSPTITGTLTVDTLKSTKGINATGGTFSGALTGTTLNTGNGANELYPMDQGVRTTDDITHNNITISGSVISNNASGLSVLTNTPDGSDNKYVSINGGGAAGSSGRGGYINIYGNEHATLAGQVLIQSGTTGDVRILGSTTSNNRINATDFDASDTVKGVTGAFSGALSSTTLNTGLGNNELHPMDQAVLTTSDVTFDSTRTRISKFDSIQLGTGSYLKNYLDTTFYDSLFDGPNYKSVRALARIVQVGNRVTLYQPEMTASSFTLSANIKGIPSKFLPYNIYKPCIVYDNSTTAEMGCVEFNNTAVMGSIYHFIRNSTFAVTTGSGQYGLRATTFEWIIQ